MQLLLSRAGLVLNPGQVADLVLAWRQVAGLIATISHDRPLVDDMALAFRLPPPAAVAAVRRARTAPKSKAKAKAKATGKAKGKAAPSRRAAAKLPSRKGTRRGR